MKKQNTSSILAITLIAAAIQIAPEAHAVASLRVTNALNLSQTVTVVDNGVGDNNALTGGINYFNFVGFFTGWTLNVSTGLSVGPGGQPGATYAYPSMDLNVVAASSGAGSLIIEFTETNFTAPLGNGWLASFGGTVNVASGSTLVYSTYRDLDNVAFGQPSAVNALQLTSQSFGPGPGSGSVWGASANDNSYSLTQKMIITHGGAGSSSGDGTLTVPDGGVTVAFLGLALIGIVGFRRKFALA